MIPQVYRDVDILESLGRIVNLHTKEFKTLSGNVWQSSVLSISRRIFVRWRLTDILFSWIWTRSGS